MTPTFPGWAVAVLGASPQPRTARASRWTTPRCATAPAACRSNLVPCGRCEGLAAGDGDLTKKNIKEPGIYMGICGNVWDKTKNHANIMFGILGEIVGYMSQNGDMIRGNQTWLGFPPSNL